MSLAEQDVGNGDVFALRQRLTGLRRRRSVTRTGGFATRTKALAIVAGAAIGGVLLVTDPASGRSGGFGGGGAVGWRGAGFGWRGAAWRRGWGCAVLPGRGYQQVLVRVCY